MVIPPDVRQAVESNAPNGVMCCTVPVDGMSSWAAVLSEFIVTSILLSSVCAGFNSTGPAVPPAFLSGFLIFGICSLEVML